MITADMHVHTYYSDGSLSPADAVKIAKANGVGLLVVTDHDNTYGSQETLALCKDKGILSTTGIEVSAYDGDVKVHLLGYGIDVNDEAYRAFCAEQNGFAYERAQEILRRLEGVGVALSMEEVLVERFCPDSPVHAMHIANAGAKKGYASNGGAFYVKYLNYGRVGFTTLGRPTPEKALSVLLAAGGFCSLAHPARLSLDDGDKVRLIERLTDCGLGGIEAEYSGHTPQETQVFRRLAERYGLLVTGGSDTHYPTGNRKIGTPRFTFGDALLEKIKAR